MLNLREHIEGRREGEKHKGMLIDFNFICDPKNVFRIGVQFLQCIWAFVVLFY